MILSAQTLRLRKPIFPFVERSISCGLSYGLSSCGYDVRLSQTYFVPPHGFLLGSTMERFDMPNDLAARVHDKSTWARRGLTVQNTIIEPGWRGHLTLELTNHTNKTIALDTGMPIAQIIFEQLDYPTQQPYDGKYQDQPDHPVEAKLEI